MQGGTAVIMLGFKVLGGLALFIYGMHIMTEGLRIAAGSRLRQILVRTTQNGVAGITLGSLLGLTIQSSAATVMLVGFINAGLMTLPQSVPVMLGANVGTTLAMQLISFRIGDYCFAGITVGFIIQMACPRPQVKSLGKSLMGFGVLFLGMTIMSEAIRPYRDVLAPYLAHIDGRTVSGLLLGVLASTAITAVIQSSGATIAMAFALISAGVITELSAVYPIILGANVGTCMTALLGSIGTNIEARRSAISHLVFNLYSCLFGMLTAPLFYHFMPLLSGSLLQQAAHANTIKMLLSALVILPVYPLFARWVVRLTPSKTVPPEPSFLEDNLISKPEKAIASSILELRRVARICAHSLTLNAGLFERFDVKKARQIALGEEAIDAVKLAMGDYLSRLTRHYLSRRQAILIQHINRCMSNLERMGDHVDRIRELLEAQNRTTEAVFDEEIRAYFALLVSEVIRIVNLVIESLDPEQKNFQEMARIILDARDRYMRMSFDFKARCNDKVASQGVGMHPVAAIYIAQYIDSLERVVRHAKTIALVESQPQFWIKRNKLHRIAPSDPVYTPPPSRGMPPHAPPHGEALDYLDSLQAEDNL